MYPMQCASVTAGHGYWSACISPSSAENAAAAAAAAAAMLPLAKLRLVSFVCSCLCVAPSNHSLFMLCRRNSFVFRCLLIDVVCWPAEHLAMKPWKWWDQRLRRRPRGDDRRRRRRVFVEQLLGSMAGTLPHALPIGSHCHVAVLPGTQQQVWTALSSRHANRRSVFNDNYNLKEQHCRR